MLYVKHYHEKNLIEDRRKCEAILNVAWAEFAEGPITKACDRLLVHWQAAMRLGSSYQQWLYGISSRLLNLQEFEAES
eukprot:COSAG02_NODE_6701_length_3413_cov_30.264937_3_plen_78_part_00